MVCKPGSHKTLCQYLSGLDEHDGITTFSIRKWNGRFHEIATYSYCNNLPIKDGDGALNVNWIKISIINEKNKKTIYENSFVTDFVINNQNAGKIVQAGRSRWKVENENNNVLKTKGYHLDHNFGHGDKYLSSTLLTLNLLAFLSHVFLEFADAAYSLVRKELSTIKTFFNDFRSLTKYLYFDSWTDLIKFMAEELELKEPDIIENSS